MPEALHAPELPLHRRAAQRVASVVPLFGGTEVPAVGLPDRDDDVVVEPGILNQ